MKNILIKFLVVALASGSIGCELLENVAEKAGVDVDLPGVGVTGKVTDSNGDRSAARRSKSLMVWPM